MTGSCCLRRLHVYDNTGGGDVFLTSCPQHLQQLEVLYSDPLYVASQVGWRQSRSVHVTMQADNNADAALMLHKSRQKPKCTPFTFLHSSNFMMLGLQKH